PVGRSLREDEGWSHYGRRSRGGEGGRRRVPAPALRRGGRRLATVDRCRQASPASPALGRLQEGTGCPADLCGVLGLETERDGSRESLRLRQAGTGGPSRVSNGPFEQVDS